MNFAAVADTHAALWHLFSDPRLSAAAGALIKEAARSRHKIAISSISVAEVIYLVEKGRLPPVAYDELVRALANPRHGFAEVMFSAAVAESMRQVARKEVPDLPDRIVAGTAVHLQVPVLSRDRKICAANVQSIW